MTPNGAPRDDDDGSRSEHPLRLAHRGDHRHALENSLAAMRAALALPGCDGLEFDLQAARDGTPVVIHDETLARTHQRAERTDALSVEELRALGVPTFADVLALAPPEAFLDVEVKTDVVAAAAEPLRGWIAGGGRAIVSSFEPGVLASLRALLPEVARWLNSEELDEATLATAVEYGCAAVSVRWDAIDADRVARARSAGLDVAGWTIVDRDVLARVERLGVVATCVEGEALTG
ncbi:MAG TPA: glycerophosphodiester phosphodiesterase [Candidatus Limnocylindrales bacterium]|nr:glycerophosphodiester phosphodiesterase [Candidatus Limnocylindrales bacterium]